MLCVAPREGGLMEDKQTKRARLWTSLESIRETDSSSLKNSFTQHLEYTLGKYKHNTSGIDIYHALAYTIRDALIDRWNVSQEKLRQRGAKRVYYISIEFLIGNLLDSQLINLDLRGTIRDMLDDFGFDLEEIMKYEPDAGLGNGGLGRLAACFLDSMATLNLPCSGSSLRYEFGMFRQQIVDGFQWEAPDNWLSRGYPWEIMRDEVRFPVHFYGYTETVVDSKNQTSTQWFPGETVFAAASDILIPGYGTRNVANLRLWRAGSYSEFNLDYFNHGNYIQALEDSVRSEYITKILYPSENIIEGRELRLKQEYFLVSATLQDALKTLEKEGGAIEELPSRVIFQLNDTHPSIAVAELMRILVDTYGMEWERAWDLTRQSLAYTNHTILPEALEQWETELLGRVLPRHLEIIYLINHRYLEMLRRQGISEEQIRRLSIIEETRPKRIRMANLAIHGSRSTNGVSALHTEILKNRIFDHYYALTPEKFNNKTNGITHRRWLLDANPELAALISDRIGDGWITDLEKMRDLEKYADDDDFQKEWRRVKYLNKEKLAGIIRFESGIDVPPEFLFDVHVKRIHEYKRQLLNVLRVIGDYFRLRSRPNEKYTPRAIIFAGKAAPGYHRAKLIIKLINSVGHMVNTDPAVRDRLRVAFLPDFRVSLAERIYPAADLSEQISTAGTEASGTGNMKFMLNGALTVGTLDGANVEMMEEVGRENIYIFGKTTGDIKILQEEGYRPLLMYRRNKELNKILASIKNDEFNPDHPGLFMELFHSLTREGDHYYHLADYESYRDIQKKIGNDYLDERNWTRKSILNSARSGKFTSDRTIREYASEIWQVHPTE